MGNQEAEDRQVNVDLRVDLVQLVLKDPLDHADRQDPEENRLVDAIFRIFTLMKLAFFKEYPSHQ